MAFVKIKKIDGRIERMNSVKLNKLFLKLIYAQNLDIDLKLRKRVFHVSEDLIKKAYVKFQNLTIPFDVWEDWFFARLEKDQDLYIAWMDFYGRTDFSEGVDIEPLWNVVGKLDENIEIKNDFDEINVFPEDVYFEEKPSKIKRKSKNTETPKSRALDVSRSTWIEWMTSLAFENMDETKLLEKVENIKLLTLAFAKMDNSVFIKKTQSDWFSWFKNALLILDKNPLLHTISRRIAYGMMKCDPDHWLDNTPMTQRMKTSFNLEEKYIQKPIEHQYSDTVWNSRVDLFIADNYPVKTLFFIYENTKVPFQSLEQKHKNICSTESKLLPFIKSQILMVDPLLLANNGSLENNHDYHYYDLKGNASDVELIWHHIANELRQAQSVIVNTNDLTEDQWFQIKYAGLVEKTALYKTILFLSVEGNHPYSEQILSPSWGEKGWLVNLIHEDDPEKLQRWLKACSQERIAIQTKEYSRTPKTVLGLRFDLFIQLELTEREECLQVISNFVKDKNLILNILGLNQALKYYEQHKEKDVKVTDSYKEWLVDSFSYIESKIHANENVEFYFGFISNDSWSHYDYLTLTNVDNDKTFRSIANLLNFLNRNNIPNIADIGISNASLLTLATFERMKESGVHQCIKLHSEN
jgi:hypothetical protein